jgi:hypothetical protein
MSSPGSSAAPAASAAPPVAVCSATRLSGLDPTRLYKYQREIADAISDPETERTTMVKAARVAPPLTAGRRAINNLLTGEGRYRIVERSKGRYRET